MSIDRHHIDARRRARKWRAALQRLTTERRGNANRRRPSATLRPVQARTLAPAPADARRASWRALRPVLAVAGAVLAALVWAATRGGAG